MDNRRRSASLSRTNSAMGKYHIARDNGNGNARERKRCTSCEISSRPITTSSMSRRCRRRTPGCTTGCLHAPLTLFPPFLVAGRLCAYCTCPLLSRSVNAYVYFGPQPGTAVVVGILGFRSSKLKIKRPCISLCYRLIAAAETLRDAYIQYRPRFLGNLFPTLRETVLSIGREGMIPRREDYFPFSSEPKRSSDIYAYNSTTFNWTFLPCSTYFFSGLL